VDISSTTLMLSSKTFRCDDCTFRFYFTPFCTIINGICTIYYWRYPVYITFLLEPIGNRQNTFPKQILEISTTHVSRYRCISNSNCCNNKSNKRVVGISLLDPSRMVH